MDPTETFTPTATNTPTETPTPTATYTPTFVYWVELTTPAGDPARLVREVSTGDYLVILLLFAILLSLWVFWIADRLKGGKKG